MSATTTTPIAGYLATGLFQVGYVTNDLERALASLRADLGIERTLILNDVAFGEAQYLGQPTDPRMNIALAGVGQHHLEIIQPLSGETPYWELLGDDYTLAWHHLGVRVASLDDALASIAATGKEPYFSGSQGDDYRFAYVDYRPELGHAIEFVQNGPEIGALMERVTRGEY